MLCFLEAEAGSSKSSGTTSELNMSFQRLFKIKEDLEMIEAVLLTKFHGQITNTLFTVTNY